MAIDIITIAEALAAVIAAILAYLLGKKIGKTAAEIPEADQIPLPAEEVMELPPKAETPIKTTHGELPDAKVEILGIYGDSASSKVPAQSYTCNVNQVPMMFVELRTVETGSGYLSFLLDGKPLKDRQMLNFTTGDIGGVIPVSFWIPTNSRTTGTHTLTVIAGAEDIADFGMSIDKKEVKVEHSRKEFQIEFTGIKFATE